jgi:hypothetical protein
MVSFDFKDSIVQNSGYVSFLESVSTEEVQTSKSEKAREFSSPYMITIEDERK